jgi:hypothetical protein
MKMAPSISAPGRFGGAFFCMLWRVAALAERVDDEYLDGIVWLDRMGPFAQGTG